MHALLCLSRYAGSFSTALIIGIDGAAVSVEYTEVQNASARAGGACLCLASPAPVVPAATPTRSALRTSCCLMRLRPIHSLPPRGT